VPKATSFFCVPHQGDALQEKNTYLGNNLTGIHDGSGSLSGFFSLLKESVLLKNSIGIFAEKAKGITFLRTLRVINRRPFLMGFILF